MDRKRLRLNSSS